MSAEATKQLRFDPLSRVLRSEFLRHGVLVFGASTLVNVANYAFQFMMSRRLGVAGYGSFASLMSLVAVFAVPSTVLTTIVVGYAAKFHAVGDHARLRALGERTLSLMATVGAAAFGVTVLLYPLIGRYLKITDGRLILIAGFLLAIALIYPVMQAVLQGSQDFRRYAGATLLEASGRLSFGLGLVALGLGVAGALLGVVLGCLASLAYSVRCIRRYAPVAERKLSFDVVRLVQTTRGVAPAIIAMASLQSSDVFLVKHFQSPSLAGLYAVVSLIGKTLFFVVGFVPILVLPKASALAARGRSALPMLAQAGAAAGFISGAGLLILALLPEQIVRITTGQAYLAAAPYVFSYGVAMTLLSATGVLVSFLVGLHRFTFVPTLLLAAAGEVVAIQFRHATTAEVISVLIVGNSIALGTTALAAFWRPAWGRPQSVVR